MADVLGTTKSEPHVTVCLCLYPYFFFSSVQVNISVLCSVVLIMCVCALMLKLAGAIMIHMSHLVMKCTSSPSDSFVGVSV